jgi:hypothetical protein
VGRGLDGGLGLALISRASIRRVLAAAAGGGAGVGVVAILVVAVWVSIGQPHGFHRCVGAGGEEGVRPRRGGGIRFGQLRKVSLVRETRVEDGSSQVSTHAHAHAHARHARHKHITHAQHNHATPTKSSVPTQGGGGGGGGEGGAVRGDGAGDEAWCVGGGGGGWCWGGAAYGGQRGRWRRGQESACRGRRRERARRPWRTRSCRTSRNRRRPASGPLSAPFALPPDHTRRPPT